MGNEFENACMPENAPEAAGSVTPAGPRSELRGMGYDDAAASVSPGSDLTCREPAAQTESGSGLSLLSAGRVRSAIEYNDARPEVVAFVPRLERVLQVPQSDRIGTGFSEALVQRIARVQQDLNSGVDGKVGPTTLGQLQANYLDGPTDGSQVDASGLWPADGSTLEQRYDHYAGIAALFGHSIRAGQPCLLGIRGVMLYAQHTHAVEHVRAYDDTYVLLTLSADGTKAVREFSGATHAYQATSGASPDVNGTGGGDVATARENDGAHLYRITNKNRFHGRTSMHITADPSQWTDEDVSGATWGPGYVPVWRDTNHDRDLTGAERTASEDRTTPQSDDQDTSKQILNGVGDYGTGVYFHPGFTQSKTDGGYFSSIACNTARMEDVDALADTARANDGVNYLIISARDVIDRQSRASSGE